MRRWPTPPQPSHPHRRRFSAANALVCAALLSFLTGSATAEAPYASAFSVTPPTTPMGSTVARLPYLPLSDSVPTIDDLRSFVSSGDDSRALAVARRIVEDKRWGRDRNAAWLVVGLIERERGHHNRASEAFTKVRAVNSPLAEIAAYFEAEQDLARGRTWVAKRECDRYLEAYPRGLYAAACQRLNAKASVWMGRGSAAEELAAVYDVEHPEAPITESVLLLRAEKAFESGQDREAIQRFQTLAIEHGAALTGRVAESRLQQLTLRGHADAKLPDDLLSQRKRAMSLRDCGRLEEAWAAYEALAVHAEQTGEGQDWVDAALEVFAKRTRHYGPLIEKLEGEYAEAPTGERTAELMHLLGRAGRWDEAAAYAAIGMKKYPRVRGFSRAEERIGRTMMLGGDYAGAQAAFESLKKRGGWRGRRGRFLEGFAALMAGDAAKAESLFAAVIEGDPYRRSAALYWRSQALSTLERHDESKQSLDELLEQDPLSWYGVMASAARDVETPAWQQLHGRWWGPEESEPRPIAPATPLPFVASFAPGQPAWSPVVRGAEAFAMITWPMTTVEVPALGRPLLQLGPDEPPSSYAESALFNRRDAGRELGRVESKHGSAFPAISSALELARVGLYDLSGPLFSGFFEEYKTARNRRSHPSHTAARDLHLQDDDWRQLFLYTRDHHHTARYLHGLDENISDPDSARSAKKLGWPLAHGRHVWTHAREHDVDPHLVMGLMRAESTYNSIAVSRVGARGAMQIMPKTGHLLADLAADEQFFAGDLEDPVLAVEYGITYLGLLQDRFDGVFPLSVAAYNGGPHNVSSWMRGTGPDMPIDAFVEHIPFRETRRYVRRVSSNYATYVDLYGPDDMRVVPPRILRDDDRTVVDF